MTYTSQNLKKVEVFEQHIEEQIVVTEVVIKSKKAAISEESEKKTIVETQVKAFKKKQELRGKKEKVKQFKATVNKKINKKKK